MARARKSHKTGEENTKVSSSTKLEPAYASTVDGHRYVIYSHLQRDSDPHQRNLILKFYGTYAARYMVDQLIGDDEYEWALWPDYEGAEGRDAMIVTSSGIKIRACKRQLKDIMEHELTELETQWSEEAIAQSVRQFKYGRGETPREELPTHSPVVKTEKAPREKKVREPKPVKEKVDTSGHISANDIAKELKVEGREVRGILRSLKLEKPTHGWSWPKKEASSIKAQIEAGLKEAKKGKKK